MERTLTTKHSRKKIHDGKIYSQISCFVVRNSSIRNPVIMNFVIRNFVLVQFGMDHKHTTVNSQLSIIP